MQFKKNRVRVDAKCCLPLSGWIIRSVHLNSVKTSNDFYLLVKELLRLRSHHIVSCLHSSRESIYIQI